MGRLGRIAEEATGWAVQEALGQPLEDIFRIVNESTRAPVENPIRKVFESGRIVGFANHTVLIRRNGTEIPIDDSASPIRDARGRIQGAVLVFRDITHQRQSDAELLHSEKLACVGRLAATIAHEINNPLESMSNLLFLIKTTKNWADVERYATSAEHELKRAAEVTKQTLSFARRDDEYEGVNVSELLDGILALYSNKIQVKHVSVQKQCKNEVHVLATKSEVRQVLGNLIGNALDALPPDGTLHVRVRASQCAGRPVARILVADSGHGIPANHLRKVFDAFFTTKKDVGTGLGLWVTKQILDGHEGCIRIRSFVGRGTVVVACWPTVQASMEVPAFSPYEGDGRSVGTEESAQ